MQKYFFMDLWMALQEPWAFRALIASAMVGISCGVLGCFIVLRNMALIGDALSHAVLPGVFFAFLIFGYSVIGFFIGSVVAGLLSAIAITWIQQNVKTKNDAAIGIVFTTMFAIGVIGISYISKQDGVHLDVKDFLFGNMLGVSNEDLYLTIGLTIYVLVNIFIFYRQLFVSTFQPVIAQTMGISVELMHYFLMLLLSFVVVASLQTVGVILVVAMLITPASTALLLTDRLHKAVIVSALVGLVSTVAGLLIAIVLDTTPGPVMAIVAASLFLLAAFLAPKRGLVFKFFQKRKIKHQIKLEDVMKQSFRLQGMEQMNFENLQARLGYGRGELKGILKELKEREFFAKADFGLTERGTAVASRLTRAHRLWETYLVKEVGLKEGQIHDDAERLEHLLSEDLLDEVDVRLGFPDKDPHGSPIPEKDSGKPEMSLIQLNKNQGAKIEIDLINEHISAALWKLGVLPSEQLQVLNKEENSIQIKQGDKTINIPTKLAARIAVK